MTHKANPAVEQAFYFQEHYNQCFIMVKTSVWHFVDPSLHRMSSCII